VLSGSEGALAVPVELLPRLEDVDGQAGAATKAAWHVADLWRAAVHLRVRDALRSGGYDVVHTNSPQGVSSAVFSGVWAAGTPHVHMAHDFNVLCMRTSLTRDGQYCGGDCWSCRPQRVIRGGLVRRSVDRLIAATDYVRERHVAAGVISDEAAVTIPYGVPPGRQRLRSTRPGREVRVGYIGTLAAHKGVGVLLEAFARAPAAWRLDIAGSGPLERSVRATADIDRRIAFAGFVDGEQKDRFLDGLDVLVVPSVWEEPAGIVALEAIIRGLPYVVTDRGGLRSMPGAEVVPAGDPVALVNGVEALLRDDGLRERSRRLLHDLPRPTLESSARRVEDVLHAVAGRRQRPRRTSS
jgi:glycosyltransferase involved in cell wall biosynthesis